MTFAIGDLMYDGEALGMIINKNINTLTIEWLKDGFTEELNLIAANWRLQRWRRLAIDLINETIPR